MFQPYVIRELYKLNILNPTIKRLYASLDAEPGVYSPFQKNANTYDLSFLFIFLLCFEKIMKIDEERLLSSNFFFIKSQG